MIRLISHELSINDVSYILFFINTLLKVSLFLIDYGKTVVEDVSNLKPLPEGLASVPGLVTEVTEVTEGLASVPGLVTAVCLRGVKPAGTQWSHAELTAARLLLDAGGNTNYQVYDVNYIGNSCYVNMADEEENDMAVMMVETGAAVPDNLVGRIGWPCC